MTLPYENATSGKNAIQEMQKLLRTFGASSFGVMEDFEKGDVIVQFQWPDLIKADVALFCTHSGVRSMRTAAALFAPEVIDVYGEIIAENPEKFDANAVAMRPFV